jgi:hypothetical protein
MWEIDLTFDRLRSDTLQELQTVIGFIDSMQGKNLPFLIAPPGGLGTYVNAPLATGDGITKSWIVTRTVGGFNDLVQAAVTITGVYVNGSPVSYTTTILPLIVTVSSPPASSSTITISYTAAHLVKFSDDTIDPQQATKNLWSLGSLKLMSVRQ